MNRGRFVAALAVFAVILFFAVRSVAAKSVPSGDAFETVPDKLVKASCTVRSGVLSISVVANADIKHVVARIGDSELDLAEDLPRGWSSIRSLSAHAPSVVVEYVWRGGHYREIVPCK